MPVYVDNVRIPFGRMLMSHLVADTTEELLAMADRIGVARRWLQKAGMAQEHFDVCTAKRELAIRAGAIACSRSDFVAVIRRKRAAEREDNA